MYKNYKNYIDFKQILHKTIEKANIKPSDIVVEFGPGTGNLT